MCYVYIIGQDDASTCKIGVSWDVPKRISDLQVASPAKLKLHYLIECEDEDGARLVERLLHARYKDVRAEREWFYKAPAEVAADIEWALSLTSAIKAINPSTVAKARLRPRSQRHIPSSRQMALEWARANSGYLGLTYRQMEEIAGVPRATLQRAIEGDPELSKLRKIVKESE